MESISFFIIPKIDKRNNLKIEGTTTMKLKHLSAVLKLTSLHLSAGLKLTSFVHTIRLNCS